MYHVLVFTFDVAKYDILFFFFFFWSLATLLLVGCCCCCCCLLPPVPFSPKMLQNVDLTGCFYIRDVSIEVLLQRCPLVERLSVRNCRKLTDDTVQHVLRNGKKVAALDIGGCFNITARGVDALCSIHCNASR